MALRRLKRQKGLVYHPDFRILGKRAIRSPQTTGQDVALEQLFERVTDYLSLNKAADTRRNTRTAFRRPGGTGTP